MLLNMSPSLYVSLRISQQAWNWMGYIKRHTPAHCDIRHSWSFPTLPLTGLHGLCWSHRFPQLWLLGMTPSPFMWQRAFPWKLNPVVFLLRSKGHNVTQENPKSFADFRKAWQEEPSGNAHISRTHRDVRSRRRCEVPMSQWAAIISLKTRWISP